MDIFVRVSGWLARFLVCALCAAMFPVLVRAGDLLSWKEAGNVPELASQLDDWLDKHSGYPRRTTPPAIWSIDVDAALALSGVMASSAARHPRGFYDAEAEKILLVRPWNSQDPHDVSVLLHELVHHRQAVNGHWYCSGAQELPAYKLQRQWLAEMGQELDVNWIAVVLEAGCSRRDIHPD